MWETGSNYWLVSLVFPYLWHLSNPSCPLSFILFPTLWWRFAWPIVLSSYAPIWRNFSIPPGIALSNWLYRGEVTIIRILSMWFLAIWHQILFNFWQSEYICPIFLKFMGTIWAAMHLLGVRSELVFLKNLHFGSIKTPAHYQGF